MRSRATKTKIHFMDLIRPGLPCVGIEKRFGILQWMVKTAQPFRVWGKPGPIELLSRKPTCINMSEILPVDSIGDLDLRFRYALCAGGAESVERWRAKNRIDVSTTRWLHFPHRRDWDRYKDRGKPSLTFVGCERPWDPAHVGRGRSEAHVRKQVAALLAARGELIVTLNSAHPKAIDVLGVKVWVEPKAFRFVLEYGADGSVWKYNLATTEGDEAFIETLDRACEEMSQVASWPEQYITYDQAKSIAETHWPSPLDEAPKEHRRITVYMESVGWVASYWATIAGERREYICTVDGRRGVEPVS